MKPKKQSTTTIVNKKARHDYEVLDTFEAGISLTGPEVKSVRLGRVQLKESHAHISEAGEVRMVNAHFSPYPFAQNDDYEPTRSRVLLLRKKEIDELKGKLQQKGLSLVPLKMYLKGNRFKVELGLVRGKKQFEKREKIKQRDLSREMRRDFKDSYRG